MSQVLYHCMYKEPEGDALQPTCLRTVNGCTDHFLFAATHFSKALAFAFSYYDPEIYMNGAVEGTDEEFAILINRQNTLAKSRQIKVYELPSKTFEIIPGRQAISKEPVYFKDCKLVFETDTIEDLMSHGLQIFSLEETISQIEELNLFPSDTTPLMQTMSALMQCGQLRWENLEQKINVNAVLHARLNKYAHLYNALNNDGLA